MNQMIRNVQNNPLTKDKVIPELLLTYEKCVTPYLNYPALADLSSDKSVSREQVVSSLRDALTVIEELHKMDYIGKDPHIGNFLYHPETKAIIRIDLLADTILVTKRNLTEKHKEKLQHKALEVFLAQPCSRVLKVDMRDWPSIINSKYLTTAENGETELVSLPIIKAEGYRNLLDGRKYLKSTT